MSSLSARLLLSVSLLLLVFFGATILVLELAFREAGEQAQRDILDGQLMTMLAAAEANDSGALDMPPDLPEARFSTIGSGLYGEIRDAAGTTVWRSPSALGLDLPLTTPSAPGQEQFYRQQLANGTPLMVLSLAVTWEFRGGQLRPFVFHVAASLDSFYAQIAAFRRQLFGWFSAVALIMLFAISLVLRGVLKPLRQVEEEIGAIENGARQALSTDYPTELRGVARNMNLLVGSERARAERYRQTLDNLAHSLKTPLAAMRAVLQDEERGAADSGARLEAQIERMNDIVRYQLRKPATLVGDRLGLAPVPVAEDLERLADGLRKVYRDKEPAIGITVAGDASFRGDRGDFMELAGNLLDNACKWCRRTVHVQVSAITGSGGRQGIALAVADDGQGIPGEAGELLLERGMRLDESAPGNGIGLAVVKDIAASYGGEVRIGRAAGGGAEFTVTLFNA
ncbi:MAG TPA: ATP-binding protein [Woeseiaceae bacterium]|nr:ATP-binding protein [Woeseiaceae bacterium]